MLKIFILVIFRHHEQVTQYEPPRKYNLKNSNEAVAYHQIFVYIKIPEIPPFNLLSSKAEEPQLLD